MFADIADTIADTFAGIADIAALQVEMLREEGLLSTLRRTILALVVLTLLIRLLAVLARLLTLLTRLLTLLTRLLTC